MSPALPDPETLTAERLAALRELREIGMGVARATGAEAEAAAGEEPKPGRDPVMRFTRVARCVRQTIALEVRISDDSARPAQHRWRRKGALADVAQAMIVERTPVAQRASLLGQLDARIDHYAEDEPEFDHLPMGVLVARICRELGVTPDWSLWADTDWAQDEARDEVPGSPFAAKPFAGFARPGVPPAPPPPPQRLPAGGLGP